MSYKGVGKLLRDPDLAAEMKGVGQHFAAQATRLAQAAGHTGAEFNVRTFQGADRVRVHVGTANVPAMLAEQRDRALARARGF